MSNKRLRLVDVMRSLNITLKEEGFEIESTAGKAFYDKSGIRGIVEGIPEYFPISLLVKDESNPVPKVEQSKAPPGLDEHVAAQAAQISNRGSSITQLTSDLAETNASITQKSTSCVGAMTSLPFSVPASSVNELHIDSARINKGSISEAHICGNTIEQETLSAVLINTLPHTPRDHAEDIALQLSGAVKMAFSALEDKGNKEASILTVKLELDTREAQERLDELRAVISDMVDSAITKALMPGGKLRKAVSQKADISELQALSSRVSQVGLALASQGGQITALQAKHASPL